jgi:predicted  nucleic acid-binding Zn-ribbon protein
VNALDALIQIHDLDLLSRELRDHEVAARLKRMGFAIGDDAPLARARRALLQHVDPRWLGHYERAQRRYGTAVAAVRGRVCQGCYMTLPRTAAPMAGEVLTVCVSCGRILYWS